MRSNEKWFGMMVAIIMCLALAGAARADWPEQDKLLASDGDAGDRFGVSVSISGDYAIVGARYDDDKGTDSGSAYIFKRDSAGWTQQVKLTASDGAAGDRFGNSVSISGDYAVVGAHLDDDSGVDSGSAYMFKRDGTSWVEQTKLTASDGDPCDYFGFFVSISGDYVIVGAFGDDSYTGSAYIFKCSEIPDDPNWYEEDKLVAPDGAAHDRFGISVSISGDYAIVGAMFNDANGLVDSGSAYIFKRDGTNWIQQPKLTAVDGAAYDRFGLWVSISADCAVVGAPLDDDNGSAYMFKLSDDVNDPNWYQQTKLIASDGAAGDQFGHGVSITGGYAIVGAQGDDDNGTSSGSAYIFKRDNTGWIQKTKLLASDGDAGDRFGWSVSISADYAIVGAMFNDANGLRDYGSAYVFKRVCPTADLDGDCWADFTDFVILGDQWWGLPGDPSADIAPEGGDGFVDFRDLAIIASQWLQGN